MSVSDINSKRRLKDKLKQVINSDKILIAYEKEDGTVATLSTCKTSEVSFMMDILEFLYITSPIAMSTTEVED